MIFGAHIIVYSKDAEADRAFFRDVLQLKSVDAGGGWLIFALPPTEVGFHPTDPTDAPSSELYLMCDDIDALIATLHTKGITANPIKEERWGQVTRIKLPSGAHLGIYQPRHTRPQS